MKYTMGKGIVGMIIVIASSVLAIIVNVVLKANRVLSLNTLEWKGVEATFGLTSALVVLAGIVGALIYLIAYYKPTMDIMNSGRGNADTLVFPTVKFIISILCEIIIVGVEYALFAPKAMLMGVIAMVCLIIGTLIAYTACKIK